MNKTPELPSIFIGSSAFNSSDTTFEIFAQETQHNFNPNGFGSLNTMMPAYAYNAIRFGDTTALTLLGSSFG